MKNHGFRLNLLKASAREQYEYQFGQRVLDKDYIEWAIDDALKHGHPDHAQTKKSKKLFKQALEFASRKWVPAKACSYRTSYSSYGMDYYIPTNKDGLFERISVSFYKGFNEVYRCFVYLKNSEARDLVKLSQRDVETIKSINFGA